MAWFAAAAAAAATLGKAAIQSGAGEDAAASALGNSGELQTPGFHKSGNVTDRRGPIARTNKFLGSELGHIAKGVGGSFLSDYRQRRNSRNRFQDLKDEGLTPQEIAGSSGGGSVQAQGNTLGSGPAVQAKAQQDFQADQAQKERDNKLNIAKLQTAAPMGQLQLSRAMQPNLINKIDTDIKATRKQMEKTDFDMRVHFPTKYLSMGVENILATIAGARKGLSVEEITGMVPLTGAKAKARDELYEEVQKLMARSRRELRGTFDVIKEISAYGMDNTIGRLPNNVLGRTLRINREAFNPKSPSFGRAFNYNY